MTSLGFEDVKDDGLQRSLKKSVRRHVFLRVFKLTSLLEQVRNASQHTPAQVRCDNKDES